MYFGRVPNEPRQCLLVHTDQQRKIKRNENKSLCTNVLGLLRFYSFSWVYLPKKYVNEWVNTGETDRQIEDDVGDREKYSELNWKLWTGTGVKKRKKNYVLPLKWKFSCLPFYMSLPKSKLCTSESILHENFPATITAGESTWMEKIWN